MARGGRGSSQLTARRVVDLTGVMTLAEKNELCSLVAAITDSMHENMTDMFDSAPVTPTTDSHVAQIHRLSDVPLHRQDNNKENQPLSTPAVPQHGKPLKPCPSTHQIIEKEEHQALTPQLQELKKEASAFCRKWQQTVLNRLRDLTVADPGIPQASFRGRGRGLRGAPRGTRGGRGMPAKHTPAPLNTGRPRLPDQPLDRDLARHYPPTHNCLWAMSFERRKLFLHIVLLLLLSLQEYSSNSRILMIHLASSLNVPLKVLRDDETRLAKGLAQFALDALLEFEEKKATGDTKPMRKWRPGFGRAGAHLPLAQPLLDADLGAPFGSCALPAATLAHLLGTMADNGNLSGGLFGTNPARPTSKTMEAYGREICDFSFIPIKGQHSEEFVDARYLPASSRRLRLVIAMSGWLLKEDDMSKIWQPLGSRSEVFGMRWEVQSQLSLGMSLETVIQSSAWRSAKKEMSPRTILFNLRDSTWPTPLLKISKIMDNPWNVGMVRAEKAGAVLADAVMRSKLHGDRPVSLVGYSLGARAIYACLMVLAERRHFGIVENVVMMGSPAPSESRVWLTLKSVVAGRLINVYCEEDYILGFLYRTSNIEFGVAGLQSIQGADKVENHKVHLRDGHVSYHQVAGQVLRDVGWEDLEPCSV